MRGFGRIDDLIEEQEKLAGKVIKKDDFNSIKTVAGVDLSGKKAAAVVFSYPELKLIESKVIPIELQFPYIPTFLTFREGPAIIKVLSKLKSEPDIILFDGNGILHPRGVGIASHVGVQLDKPTIGVAKSLLCGEVEEPEKIGEYRYIYFKDKIIGASVKTSKAKPVYVSIGHRISLKTAIEIVLNCSSYRLPEPIRQADILANRRP